VQLQIRKINGFVMRGESEWPLARTRWTRLYLNPADRSLSRKPGKDKGSVSYVAPGDGVTFMTPPLEQEMEITGPVASRLFISSSTTDADIFLILRVFAPDGKEVVPTPPSGRDGSGLRTANWTPGLAPNTARITPMMWWNR
jgi:predicted acyl esterase